MKNKKKWLAAVFLVVVMAGTAVFIDTNRVDSGTDYKLYQYGESDYNAKYLKNGKDKKDGFHYKEMQETKRKNVQKDISIFGKKYHSQYVSTHNVELDDNMAAEYRAVNSKNTDILLNSNTNGISYVRNDEAGLYRARGLKGENDYIQLAKKLLRNYIDVDKYKCHLSTDVIVRDKNGEDCVSYDTFYDNYGERDDVVYKITFTRYIEDMLSSDLAILEIDRSGKVIALSLKNIGAFDKVNFEDLDIRRMRAMAVKDIEQRIDTEECNLKDCKASGEILLKYEGKYFVLLSNDIRVQDKATREEVGLENELSLVEIPN